MFGFWASKVKCIRGLKKVNCVSFDLLKGEIGEILGYSSSCVRFDGKLSVDSEGSKCQISHSNKVINPVKQRNICYFCQPLI